MTASDIFTEEEIVLDPSRPAVTRLPYAEAAVRKTVAVAIGAGSACWDQLEGAGVFKSERAVEIVDGAVERILKDTHLGEPSLGCATTAELRDELAARERMGHTNDNYRPMDDD